VLSATANDNNTPRTGRITASSPGLTNQIIEVTQGPSFFTLTLNANSGTVNPTSVNRQPGAFAGELPIPIRGGHGFVGWFDAQTGGAQIFSNTIINRNMTIFARWQATTITFYSEGGAPVVPASRSITGGAPIGELPPAPTRQGSTLGQRFEGWYVIPRIGGAAVRITENSLAPNYSIVAYARWECNLDARYHWRQFGMWIFWRNNNVPLRAYEINADLAQYWHTAMEDGRLSWNNSNAPVNFTLNQSTNNRVTAGTHELTVAGDIDFILLGGLSRFTITLDSPRIYHLAAENNVTVTHYIQSVMAHELGHSVGLEDCFGNSFGGGPNGSIMNRNRSRTIVRGPTDFDIENVRRIYD